MYAFGQGLGKVIIECNEEVLGLLEPCNFGGMKLSRKSSKGEAESYSARKYEGYQGAPKPVYSYSPTIELVAYKDGTYEWKSSDNWKLNNEAELQSYISSSPTKENQLNFRGLQYN